MGCCGKSPNNNRSTDKRGNSLRKVAFLHPHQRRILEAEDLKIEEEKKKKEEEAPKEDTK